MITIYHANTHTNVWVTISTQEPEAQTHRPSLRYNLIPSTPESTATHKSTIINYQLSIINLSEAKAFGQLVVLGFDVAVFTPAPYQRHRL